MGRHNVLSIYVKNIDDQGSERIAGIPARLMRLTDPSRMTHRDSSTLPLLLERLGWSQSLSADVAETEARRRPANMRLGLTPTQCIK
jgi:hypothetical protein